MTGSHLQSAVHHDVLAAASVTRQQESHDRIPTSSLYTYHIHPACNHATLMGGDNLELVVGTWHLPAGTKSLRWENTKWPHGWDKKKKTAEWTINDTNVSYGHKNRRKSLNTLLWMMRVKLSKRNTNKRQQTGIGPGQIWCSFANSIGSFSFRCFLKV